MRLLDLYCGAGGAAVGYARAGFTDIVGVDIVEQPNYPFRFVQADAVAFMDAMIETTEDTGYDLIHASPPCQAYTGITADRTRHPDVYDLTREALDIIGRPYVIENVPGAPYRSGIVLCGSMFDLEDDGEWVQRHRNFETSFLIFQPAHNHPARRAVTVTGKSFVNRVQDYGHSRQGPLVLAERLMGIDWMTRAELVQAIPPAYTEWIGEQFVAQRKVTA